MATDITKFLGRISREEDILNHFANLQKKISTKRELRNLELKLLKPRPIDKYTGPKVGRTSFKQRSLVVVFKNKTFIERIGKFIKVNKYATNNTYHVNLFEELIRLLEDGRIEFDYKKNRFYVIGKTGAKIRL